MHSKQQRPVSCQTGSKEKACTSFALYLKVFKNHLYYLWHVRVLSIKGVHAHCYWASLVRTLSIGHAHENSGKYRADDLCVNFVCEYFCWMLGEPHFFLPDHFLF